MEVLDDEKQHGLFRLTVVLLALHMSEQLVFGIRELAAIKRVLASHLLAPAAWPSTRVTHGELLLPHRGMLHSVRGGKHVGELFFSLRGRNVPFNDFHIQHGDTVKHRDEQQRDEGRHCQPADLRVAQRLPERTSVTSSSRLPRLCLKADSPAIPYCARVTFRACRAAFRASPSAVAWLAAQQRRRPFAWETADFRAIVYRRIQPGRAHAVRVTPAAFKMITKEPTLIWPLTIFRYLYLPAVVVSHE